MQLFYDLSLSTKYQFIIDLITQKTALTFPGIAAAFYHFGCYWEAGGACVCGEGRIGNARELGKILVSS